MVDWANLLVEPETTNRESAILVTELHADAMPMIRYRVGDMARFPEGSRPGCPVLALEEVTSRQLDVLHLPDGRRVHGADIVRVLSGNLPGVPIRLQCVAEIARTGAGKWRPIITHVGREAAAAIPKETS